MSLFERILVPLDGSARAEGVLPYVATLARGLGAHVTLLHVVDTTTLRAVMAWEPEQAHRLEELVAHSRKAAREYLREQVRRLEELGVQVQAVVLQGQAASSILGYAREQGADLVALCTHGRAGLARFLLGSVATRLVQRSTAPLLVVRPRHDGGPGPVADLREVMVPLDGSDFAAAVLPLAEGLATALDLSIALVQVLPTELDVLMGTEWVIPPIDFLDRARRGAREYLESVAQELRAKGLRVGWQLLEGEAGSAIVEAVRETPGTLVAMTTHGRSGLGRWLLGSVADKVVRATGAPVLLMRSQGAPAQD